MHHSALGVPGGVTHVAGSEEQEDRSHQLSEVAERRELCGGGGNRRNAEYCGRRKKSKRGEVKVVSRQVEDIPPPLSSHRYLLHAPSRQRSGALLLLCRLHLSKYQHQTRAHRLINHGNPGNRFVRTEVMKKISSSCIADGGGGG